MTIVYQYELTTGQYGILFMMQKKLILQFGIVYLILVAIFFCTLVLTSLLPSSWLHSNISKSISTLKKEGIYANYGLPSRQVLLDNFTDSLMLNTAYSVESKDPIKSALLNIRYDGTEDGGNQVKNLEKLYHHKDITPVNYERYWHGYLSYLRPLLTVMPYSGIRIFLTNLLYLGFIIFTILSWIRLGKKVTFAFILGLIAVDFFYLGQSMQFSNVFIICSYSAIYALWKYKKNVNMFLLFFIVGALTSFFDLLTTPLVTLGMLLIIAVKLHEVYDKQKKINVRAIVKNILFYCISWTSGYLLLWFTKWLLVEILFTPGAIVNAFNQITNRTITQPDPQFSHIQTLKLNIFQLIGYNKINKIIVLCLGILSSIIFLKYILITKERLCKTIPWFIIAAIPYLWYLVAANHSYLHVWYTYRSQFMSVVALFLVASELMNWERIKADINVLKKLFISKSTSKSHKD
ncbi:MAG TPA: hypothetical protein VK338_05005 [Candidatus Nitrosocosmicus sp.]|nr:hypothetical protein [Candidatus Nitrosocosmicus sp.]